jgi:membrane protease YdiL (CAAX protease family)
MDDKKKYYPTIRQSGNLLLLSLGILVLLVILLAFLSNGLPRVGIRVPKAVEEVTLYLFGFIIIIWIAIKRKRKNGEHAGLHLSLNKTSGINVLILLAATVCLGTIIDPIINAIPMPKSFEHLFDDLLFSLSKYPVLAVFSIAIAPGIMEEILFRGIILDGFLKNYKPQKAIMVSALLFGLIHLNPWQFIGGLAFGLLLGWTYWKTRSLLICMLMHALNNLTALVQYWNTNQITDSMYERLGKQNFVLFYIATVIVFIGCMRALNKNFKKTGQNGGALPV